MKKFIKEQSGQSLIELSVAVGITSIALIAILSLVLVSIAIQRRGYNYYTAINLAREAIEVARNTRDTNWLLDECQREGGGCDATAWNDNLRQVNIYSAILFFNPTLAENKFSFDFRDTLPTSDNESKIIYKKDFGATTLYLDLNTCTFTYSDCQQTIFKRWIYLKPICDGSDPDASMFSDSRCPKENPLDAQSNFICNNEGVCDPNLAPQIGIRVISEVSWQEGSHFPTIKLADDIYNWR